MNRLNSSFRYKTKPNNIVNQSPNINFKKNFSFFTLFAILLFITFDYLVFTQTFNFSNSRFVEVYVQNIDFLTLDFLLIFTVLPLAILSTPYLISAIITNLILDINEKSNFKFMTNGWFNFKNYKINLFLLATIFSLLTILIQAVLLLNLFNEINNMSLLGVIIIAYVSIAVSLYISLQLLKSFDYVTKNKMLENLSISFMVAYFIMNSILIAVIGIFDQIQIIGSLLIIMDIPVIITFQIFPAFLERKKAYQTKPHKIYGISLLLIIAIFLVSLLHQFNDDMWKSYDFEKSDKSLPFTLNLQLNKLFLDPIDKKVVFETMNLVKKEELNNEDISNVLSKGAFYLPLGKGLRLYFSKNPQNKYVLIYIIEEYDHDKKYRLIDIGFINKEEVAAATSVKKI